jgi:hypothetical protein
MADVTWHITDERAGFPKLSMCIAIQPDHKVEVLCVSVLVSESKHTFIFEAQFLKETYIAFQEDASFVTYVDGDKGRIGALETVFPGAKVYLCLIHKAANVKGRCPNNRVNAVLRDKSEKKANAEEEENAEEEDVFYIMCDCCNEWIQVRKQIISRYEQDESLSYICTVCRDTKEEVEMETENQFLKCFSERKGQQFHKMNASFAFKYILKCSDVNDGIKRCKDVVEIFPEQSDYFHKEIIPNMHRLVDFTRIWQLTFGLDTTAIQENSFWTLKSKLGGNMIPLHQLPDFVHKCFTDRYMNQVSRHSVALTSDLKNIEDNGFPELVSLLKGYASDSGKIALVKVVKARNENSIDVMFDESAVYERMDSLQAIDSNHMRRFLLYVEQAPKPRTIYTVKKNINNSVFYVCIDGSGSSACSCGDFATYGCPCCHYFALYASGHVAFNIVRQCHSVYFLDVLRHMNDDEVDKLTVQKNCSNATVPRGVKWDTPIRNSEKQWLDRVCSGSDLLRRTDHHHLQATMQENPKTKREIFTQNIHALKLYMLLLALRDNVSNIARCGYDLIGEYTLLRREDISDAIVQ